MASNDNSAAASDDDTMIVLPCYSDMENDDIIYWLFLTNKAQLQCEDIKGKWLERFDGHQLKYELWTEEETSICKENAIRQDDQFICFKKNIYFNQSGPKFTFLHQCLLNLEEYIKTSLLLEK